MPLTLYYHPLSSYCHKVLIALYENETTFDAQLVDFGDPASTAQLTQRWPIGKIPLIEDGERGEIVPETSIIIEYLDRYYPGPARLLPAGEDARREVRLWDRLFDLYVHTPVQNIVLNQIQPETERRSRVVTDAEAVLETAYTMAESRLADRDWVCGDNFSMADCAACPSLFYASTLVPFGNVRPRLSDYFERLLERPSVRRVLDEARPWFNMYPFHDRIPARFLDGGA